MTDGLPMCDPDRHGFNALQIRRAAKAVRKGIGFWERIGLWFYKLTHRP